MELFSSWQFDMNSYDLIHTKMCYFILFLIFLSSMKQKQ